MKIAVCICICKISTQKNKIRIWFWREMGKGFQVFDIMYFHFIDHYPILWNICEIAFICFLFFCYSAFGRLYFQYRFCSISFFEMLIFYSPLWYSLPWFTTTLLKKLLLALIYHHPAQKIMSSVSVLWHFFIWNVNIIFTPVKLFSLIDRPSVLQVIPSVLVLLAFLQLKCLYFIYPCETSSIDWMPPLLWSDRSNCDLMENYPSGLLRVLLSCLWFAYAI